MKKKGFTPEQIINTLIRNADHWHEMETL